jgi:hypothetical protein
MRVQALSIIALLTTLTAQAGDFAVISVVRTLPMKTDDVIVKDYYINAGTNNGLVSGATLDAHRKMPVYDNINAKVVMDTSIPVAKLKVIHVDGNMAIARMVQMLDRKSNPNPGFDDIMIGDVVKVSKQQ